MQQRPHPHLQRRLLKQTSQASLHQQATALRRSQAMAYLTPRRWKASSPKARLLAHKPLARRARSQRITRRIRCNGNRPSWCLQRRRCKDLPGFCPQQEARHHRSHSTIPMLRHQRASHSLARHRSPKHPRRRGRCSRCALNKSGSPPSKKHRGSRSPPSPVHPPGLSARPHLMRHFRRSMRPSRQPHQRAHQRR